VTAYLHPIIGGTGLLLLVYVASLGFRMRTARRTVTRDEETRENLA
jgi:hypothetical protein